VAVGQFANQPGPTPKTPSTPLGAGRGFSLAQIDHGTASDVPGNWAASAQMSGTPGAEDFPTPPDVTRAALSTRRAKASS